MKYSDLFTTMCVICSQRSYDFAMKPPLWKADKCWNHLHSNDKHEWRTFLLNSLHSTGTIERFQEDFLLFRDNYLKTDKARNVLKMHGYDKYLLEHVEVSSFSELEAYLRQRLSKLTDINFFKLKNDKHFQNYLDDPALRITTILRENWLKQKDQQFVSFQGVDLSGEDLSGCRLEFILFDGAKLSNAKFTKSILSHSIFNNTDMTNSSLDEADITSCSFEDANLTGSNLSASRGEKVCFRKSKIMNCNARSSIIAEADFTGVELNKTDFTNARLNHAKFSSVEMKETDFTAARLQHADFSNSKIRQCSFKGVQMFGANFTNSKLIETQFNDVNCANGVFINSDLSNLNLQNGNFSKADFTRCNLEKALICDSDLEGANMTGGNLRFADLRNTNLREVDLYKADLEATRIYLENVQFSGILTRQLKDGSLAIERANKIRVFISYSHADLEFALRFENALRERSIDVWIDRQEILPGDSLIEKIREGIDSSQYVCALISSTSIQSKWVKNELDTAMNQQMESGKVKVIPLVLEENLTLPSFLVGKLYVDFSKIDYFDRGISQIQRRLDASQY